jgi:DNA-binding IclR family transcriptional regulator
VLPCIAHDPGVRLRDTAARTGVTERTGYGIVTDLTEAGYVVKHKDGRRNRYQIRPTCRSRPGRCHTWPMARAPVPRVARPAALPGT